MRLFLVLRLILVICISSATFSLAGNPRQSPQVDTTTFTCSDSTAVPLHNSLVLLPTDSLKLYSMLWEKFINSPDCDRFNCLVDGWRSRAEAHIRTLIRKARADSLNATMLERCLRRIMNSHGENAFVPVSVSRGMLHDKPCWILVIKWEWMSASSRERLGHARVYVMDASTTDILAFATCD